MMPQRLTGLSGYLIAGNIFHLIIQHLSVFDEMMFKVEIIILVVSLVATIVSGYVSVKAEERRISRFATALSVLLLILVSVAGAELLFQQRAEQSAQSQAEKEWPIVKDALVTKLEVELVIVGGGLRLEDAEKFLYGTRFVVSDLNSALQDGLPMGTIDITSALKKSYYGRAGRLSVTSVTRGEEREFVGTECSATKRFARYLSEDDDVANQVVCSLTIVVTPATSFPLRQIFDADIIRLSTQAPDEVSCVAPCSDIFVSVRASLNSGSGLVEDMIELSPMAYKVRSRTAEDGTSEFLMSGAAVEEVSETIFRQTLGFRKNENFLFTKGLLFRLFASESSSTILVEDLVWSSSYNPSHKSLTANLTDEQREIAEPLRIREWCGFGRDDICWNLFAITVPLE